MYRIQQLLVNVMLVNGWKRKQRHKMQFLSSTKTNYYQHQRKINHEFQNRTEKCTQNNNKKKQKQLLDSERAGELPIWTENDINNLMQLNLHSLTLKINTNCWLRAIHCCWHWTSQKDIACFFPHLRRAINPYSIYRKWQRKKKKAITNFLHSTLQRGPKEPQDSIISVGFKREKWDDPYNAHNLFPLFLKNKINWKTICLNHSFGEFV